MKQADEAISALNDEERSLKLDLERSRRELSVAEKDLETAKGRLPWDEKAVSESALQTLVGLSMDALGIPPEPEFDTYAEIFA